mmetsp:Transcript_2317/g.10548  ORF Transcript_2317/g.10548 Transcript_2317/m.10548 type:complete len:241 (+) Transcript_2317:270-992(+)
MSSSAARTTWVRWYPSLTPLETFGGESSGDNTQSLGWNPPTDAIVRVVFGKCRFAIALGSTSVSSHSGSEDQPARANRRDGLRSNLDAKEPLRGIRPPPPAPPSDRTLPAAPVSLFTRSSLHASSSSAASATSFSTKSSSGVLHAVDLRNARSSFCIASVRSSTVLTQPRPGLASRPVALVSSNPEESADLARCLRRSAVYGRYTGRRHTLRQKGRETSASATASTTPTSPSCADRASRQ